MKQYSIDDLRRSAIIAGRGWENADGAEKLMRRYVWHLNRTDDTAEILWTCEIVAEMYTELMPIIEAIDAALFEDIRDLYRWNGDNVQCAALVKAIASYIPKAEKAPRPVDPAKQRRGEVPDKPFIGSELSGRGWRILFDGDAGKTRVIFDRFPSAAQKEAVKAAGFWWNACTKSWNKRLTMKAFRAAQELAAALNAA